MGASFLRHPSLAIAGTCDELKNQHHDYDQLTRAAAVAQGNQDQTRSLASFIMYDSNTDYAGGDLYLWRNATVTQKIQRDASKTPWKWPFQSPTPTISISRSMRIPYFGTAKDSGQCTSEHVLVGLSIGAAAASGTTTAWVLGTGGQARDIDVLGNFIVTTLGGAVASGTSPTPGLCYKGWFNTISPSSSCTDDTVCVDATERMWSFRGAPVHIDSALRIPYAVTESGVTKRAWLYVGYEGGGSY